MRLLFARASSQAARGFGEQSTGGVVSILLQTRSSLGGSTHAYYLLLGPLFLQM